MSDITGLPPEDNFANDDLSLLLNRAENETNPQARAVLWGECICEVLDLEDIREGLTFDELRAMNDDDANRYADHMRDVFEMRCSWSDGVPMPMNAADEMTLNEKMNSQGVDYWRPQLDTADAPSDAKRVKWPPQIVRAILTKCHFRCCVCPEHRRIADIHHMDGDNSNSVEINGVALCKLCHTDAHTTSTMQRNLQKDHLVAFKLKWEHMCLRLARSRAIHGKAISNVYYMNVHRLDSLLRELGQDSVLKSVPHRPTEQPTAYNTLWGNPKNTLDWMKLLENRNHFESCLATALKKLHAIDLNLIEVGAVDANEHVGSLVTFNCELIGCDIPHQSELVETNGLLEGPPPTMRRELIDPKKERVIETCMMLDSQYMYSDSAFLMFSETGVWSGIGRLTKIRDAIGSNDGHLLRCQLVVTPICIGTPESNQYYTSVQSGKGDPEQEYNELLEDSTADE